MLYMYYVTFTLQHIVNIILPLAEKNTVIEWDSVWEGNLKMALLFLVINIASVSTRPTPGSFGL